MSLLDYFRRRKPTASIAKERLQIIIAHERTQRDDAEDYLVELQREILDVIAKYVAVDRDQVKVQLERIGENSILELNVTMPEKILETADA